MSLHEGRRIIGVPGQVRNEFEIPPCCDHELQVATRLEEIGRNLEVRMSSDADQHEDRLKPPGPSSRTQDERDGLLERHLRRLIGVELNLARDWLARKPEIVA